MFENTANEVTQLIYKDMMMSAPNHIRDGKGKLIKNVFLLKQSTSKYPKLEDQCKTVLQPYKITRQQRRAQLKPWKTMRSQVGRAA